MTLRLENEGKQAEQGALILPRIAPGDSGAIYTPAGEM